MKVLLAAVAVSVTVVANSPAHSQKSTSLIKSDPRASYLLIKELIRDDSRPNFSGDIKESIELARCLADASYPPRFDGLGPVRRSLVELATFVLYARAELINHHFPSALWEEALTELERGQLDFIVAHVNQVSKQEADDNLDNLIKNAVRKIQDAKTTSRRTSLANVLARGECLPGEVFDVQFKTTPPNGDVLLISKLFYLLCQRQPRLDPLNVDQCDSWLPPVRPGQTIGLVGVYKYRLRWGTTISTIDELLVDRVPDRPIPLK